MDAGSSAYAGNIQHQPSYHEEEQKVRSIVERELGEAFMATYQTLITKMTMKKSDSNSFGSAFRIFSVAPTAVLGFPNMTSLRQNYGRGIAALYIFKMHNPHHGGSTHGIHVRLHGYVHRKIFEQLLQDIVSDFTGEQIKLKSIQPQIKNTVSLFDYLQTLYVHPHNLIINMSHQHDAVARAMSTTKVDTQKTSVLKNKMKNLTSQIIDNMITMPNKYEQSYLFSLLNMTPKDFRLHMRATDINEIVMQVCQDAYNIALQDRTFKQSEAHELMEPVTRRAMLNRCITENITKQIHLLLQQAFTQPFIHPHPFNGLYKSSNAQLRPLDGLIFDPRFLFSILLTARWFARSCMRVDDMTSSNFAHLLLYGGAGTGKTLITSAISSCIPTYRFLTNGAKFQNPDILHASLLRIEECDTETLLTNEYKALLDLKCSMKLDFKNLNPENVTEGMPSMITTNDDIYSKLRGNKKCNQASVDAALRRLYIIPMKAGSFEKLHGGISKQSQYYADVAKYETMYENEPNRLQRIFNLILALALYQQDIQGMYADQRMYAYFRKISNDFVSTSFGTFYLQNKKAVDQCVVEVEEMLMGLECDDSSYLVRVASSAGQFQQLIYQFLENILTRAPHVKSQILRDTSVPWILKAYYFMNDYDFNVGLMWDGIAHHEHYLNPEIRGFFGKAEYQPYAAGNLSDGLQDMYMDSASFTSSQGEHVHCSENILVLPNPNEDSFLGKRDMPDTEYMLNDIFSFKRQRL